MHITSAPAPLRTISLVDRERQKMLTYSLLIQTNRQVMKIRENFEDDKILPPLMKVILDCLSHLICQYTKMRQSFDGVINICSSTPCGASSAKNTISTLEAFETFEAFGNKKSSSWDSHLVLKGTKFCFMMEVTLDCLSQSICQHIKTRQTFNGVTRSAAQLLVVQVLRKTPLSTIEAFEAFRKTNE